MNVNRFENKNELARFLYNIAGRTSYKNEYGAFYDITEGRAGGYRAREGYNFITGLGCPDIEN